MEISYRTAYAYDQRTTLHSHPNNPKHVENPQRVTVPYEMLSGILLQCLKVEERLATDEELQLVHTKEFIDKIKLCSDDCYNQFYRPPENFPTYTSNSAFTAAACAVGGLLGVVDAVCSGKTENGLALIRPPGHHAEVDNAGGFCFFNTIAIAAKHAQKKYPNIRKVLIFDWDIHHGNGVQHVFYEDSSVLYVSLHRYDNGEYYPNLQDSCCEAVGENKGAGFNINIAWNKDMMGDSEYKAAFDQIVLPVAKQFNPDLILIASGFDAAAADPLGDYVVTPQMYAYMIQKLSPLAQGRVILELEGGYNPQMIGQCLDQCLRVLMSPEEEVILTGLCSQLSKRALQTLDCVKRAHMKYWQFGK